MIVSLSAIVLMIGLNLVLRSYGQAATPHWPENNAVRMKATNDFKPMI